MWKYAMLLVAASGLFACEDPEVGETLPDYYSKIFVTIQTSGSTDLIEAQVENTPIGVFPKTEYNRQLVINLTRELKTDLTIEIGADPSLLAARAEADGVEYKALPESACVLPSESIVIPAGERQAVVNLSLGDTSFASETQGNDSFMLPLVITKVSDPSVTISKQVSAAFCKVNASFSLMREINSPSEVIGLPERPTGWTQTGGDNNIIDGDQYTSWRMPKQYDNLVTIDMGAVKHVTGLGVKGHQNTYTYIDMEYSVDGENWLSAGRIDRSMGYVVNGSSYGAFYGSADARYLRLNFGVSSSFTSYRIIYEVMVYTAEFLEPYAYLSTSQPRNEVNATVVHRPSGSTAAVAGTITAHVSEPSASGYTVNFTVDNSLVEEYNDYNYTDYVALPDGLLNIPECTIDAMAYASSAIRPELTGNLSSLTEPVYLVPLRISVDGMKSSEQNGVAYMIIATESNAFMASPTAASVRGSYVENRSAFRATNGDSGSSIGNVLFDGSSSSISYDKNLNIDLGATYNVSGLKLNYYYANSGLYYRPVKMRISTSDNGTSWAIRGTLTDQYWQRTGADFLLILTESIECRHIKIELLEYGNNNSYYYGMCEFGIYAE